MVLVLDDFERTARRQKMDQILAAQERDAERMAHLAQLDPAREAIAPEALDILARLRDGGDVVKFKDEMGAWSKQPAYESFGGFGQMFINQLVNAGADDPQRVGDLLADVFTAPTDEQDARSKLQRLLAYVDEVKKGAHPAPKRAIYVASFFWQLADSGRWPCHWASAEKMLQRLGWTSRRGDLADRYIDFRDVVLSLELPVLDVLAALHWFEEHPWVGLDPSLVERCCVAYELRQTWADGDYPDADTRRRAERLARSLVSEPRLLGDHLEQRVAEALGRTVQPGSPDLLWSGTDQHYRTDGFVRWQVQGSETRASLLVWATADGVAVALSNVGPHADKLKGFVPPGHRFLRVRLTANEASRIELDPPDLSGNLMIGRWFDGDSALDREDFAEDVVAVAADLQPVLDVVLGSDGLPDADALGGADELAELVKVFIAERAYPTDKDVQHRADREAMAEMLSADELPLIDLPDLRIIYSGKRYGYPGHQANLSRTFRDASPADLETYMHRLSELLWGEGEVSARVDRALEAGDLAIKGLGEAVIMKFLAVTQPERFIPVYPYAGDMGKLRMLKLLGLHAPADGLSRGTKQVRANDALRQRLDKYFPGDPWGQGQFLYWLNRRDEGGGAGVGDDVNPLHELADRLLVPRAFVDDIVDLLDDKGQVIFYGPPGTGKTYLARELAKVLAPDPNRRSLVQFHPSMSYEDFFEGYRPEGSDDGSLSYRLTSGPLARLAERAEKSPGAPHVMVIDEINRANLPKVLGELLFLLEYRSETVRTTYRPDEGFELPPDLQFIGTMNTADRSIALVDAALRRRFHFVPFFPNDGPMAGLLQRWLEREGEATWVADLVDMVNAELRDELGGPHLQIGPSHFMRRGISEENVRRIWTYNIFPFIEDQLFGEPDRIKQFEYGVVLKRFRSSAGIEEAVPLETYEAEQTE